jgi:hypothetical protein
MELWVVIHRIDCQRRKSDRLVALQDSSLGCDRASPKMSMIWETDLLESADAAPQLGSW